ncbi:MAG TPA: hypothetical protein VEK34_05585 [Methylocella sp.]|nr:hypothetical protein [Methylocella sp.]
MFTLLPAAPATAADQLSVSPSGRDFFRLLLFFLSGALLAVALIMPAKAGENRILVIPANDGYGFEECLKTGDQCGLMVADAWCKAHGFGSSQGYGPETASSPESAPGYVVTCGDRID